MTKNLKFSALFLIGLLLLGCQKAVEPKTANAPNAKPPANENSIPKPESESRIDVPRLAGKTAEELDKVLGAPEKITPAVVAKEMPGEYRLYKISGNAKGLSVRFYRNRAVRFNLILEKPFASASDALRQAFNIDTKNIAPTVDKNEPLSQKWQGEFGGVKFATVYAKKDRANGQFVMVHAELAR